jgi:hypothetical protein
MLTTVLNSIRRGKQHAAERRSFRRVMLQADSTLRSELIEISNHR